MSNDLDAAIARLRSLPEHLNHVSLNRAEATALLAALDKRLDRRVGERVPMPPTNVEDFRRERPTLDANPINFPGGEFLDYAHAGTLIDVAVHHLDEGLPNGQKRRCAMAFAMLDRGVYELETWMRAKGYFDDDAA